MNLKKTIKEKILPGVANELSNKIFINLLLNNAISRCATGAATRNIRRTLPSTWEFSGFSQNGEDGIIDYLLNNLRNGNKYFIEIGSGNGLENNTSYLAHIKKFAGLQIEANSGYHDAAQLIKPWLTESMNCFVSETTINHIFDNCLYKDPDVFSIDIDGMEYYILKLLFEKGLRPKILVSEYNSAFGPDRSITVPYDSEFNMFKTDYPYLYYGVSLSALTKLLSAYNYHFLTVETNGVNAFFIDKTRFTDGFTDGIEAIDFKENIHQYRLFKKNWEGQFEIIKDLPFNEV